MFVQTSITGTRTSVKKFCDKFAKAIDILIKRDKQLTNLYHLGPPKALAYKIETDIETLPTTIIKQ